MKTRPAESERSRDQSVTERSNSERVSVYVRLRPYTEDEYIKDRQTCVESFDLEAKTIVSMIFHSFPRRFILCAVKRDFERKIFTFDNLADPKSDQADVYRIVAQPVVQSVLNGYNGTIFAYGQVTYLFIFE